MKTDKDNTVTRADLADAIYREIGLSKSESAALVTSIFDHISEHLASEGSVKLSGFGNFTISLKSERMGRNPKTKEPVIIPPRRVVTFKPSPKFRDRVIYAVSNYTTTCKVAAHKLVRNKAL